MDKEDKTKELINKLVDKIGKEFKINYDKDGQELVRQINKFIAKNKEEDTEGVLRFACKQVAKMKADKNRIEKIKDKDIKNARSKKKNE